ncbi:hypothetical protein HKX48_007326 [Thoreauomyces humboldtii]|nr:hypothetical protein HKX48_007326 [Thoreauomyces humboldtii]
MGSTSFLVSDLIAGAIYLIIALLFATTRRTHVAKWTLTTGFLCAMAASLLMIGVDDDDKNDRNARAAIGIICGGAGEALLFISFLRIMEVLSRNVSSSHVFTNPSPSTFHLSLRRTGVEKLAMAAPCLMFLVIAASGIITVMVPNDSGKIIHAVASGVVALLILAASQIGGRQSLLNLLPIHLFLIAQILGAVGLVTDIAAVVFVGGLLIIVALIWLFVNGRKNFYVEFVAGPGTAPVVVGNTLRSESEIVVPVPAGKAVV